MTQVILDIVAEDAKKPHVPDNMDPPAMQEHGSENREKRPRNRVHGRSRQGAFEMQRHNSELKHQRIRSMTALHSHRELKQKRNNVQPNNEVVYEGRAETRLVVANGKHGIELSDH